MQERVDGARAYDARVSSDLAAEVVRLLAERRLTLATAESLTGGGVGAAVTSVPGSSAVYLGGVISYTTRVKVDLLEVPLEIVHGDGVVSAPCARAMAAGVRRMLGADLAVSTTGVAGPDRQEGKPAGTVFVAVADVQGESVRPLSLHGDRAAIRAATTKAALELVGDRISAIR